MKPAAKIATDRKNQCVSVRFTGGIDPRTGLAVEPTTITLSKERALEFAFQITVHAYALEEGPDA